MTPNLGIEMVSPGRVLSAIGENLANKRPLLVGVGAFIQAKTQQAFKDQGRPAGSWPARMVPNFPGIIRDFHESAAAPKSNRFESRPALLDTGDLKRSITSEVVGPDTVEIGTNLGYGQAHQKGDEVETLPISEGFQDWLRTWLAGPGAPWSVALRWLLRPFWTGQTTSVTVRARPFLKVTPEDVDDLRELLGVNLALPAGEQTWPGGATP